MCKEKIIDNRIRQRGRIPIQDIPDIPESEWCDLRRDYESGMTLKKIAEKHHCDPRTVGKCIRDNTPSSEIGKQKKPTKLAAFVDQIDTEYRRIITDPGFVSDTEGICGISKRITDMITRNGYTGGERTVREYLRNKYQFPRKHKKSEKESGNDKDKDNT